VVIECNLAGPVRAAPGAVLHGLEGSPVSISRGHGGPPYPVPCPRGRRIGHTVYGVATTQRSGGRMESHLFGRPMIDELRNFGMDLAKVWPGLPPSSGPLERATVPVTTVEEAWACARWLLGSPTDFRSNAGVSCPGCRSQPARSGRTVTPCKPLTRPACAPTGRPWRFRSPSPGRTSGLAGARSRHPGAGRYRAVAVRSCGAGGVVRPSEAAHLYYSRHVLRQAGSRARPRPRAAAPSAWSPAPCRRALTASPRRRDGLDRRRVDRGRPGAHRYGGGCRIPRPSASTGAARCSTSLWS